METIEQKIGKVFKNGQSVLFLERDNGLHNAVGNFETILLEQQVKYNALFRIDKLPMEYIIEQLEFFEIIVFQTGWDSDISENLEKLLYSKKFERPKIIVECFSSRPTWDQQQPVDHEFYVFRDWSDEDRSVDRSEWGFKQLTKERLVW